jgi:Kef-type K+ transport system membrane component KefB
MPRVVGEIFGGIILGPTLLGYLFPTIFEKLFLEQGELLAVIYWLGLVLLMFTSGFEIERKFDKKDKKTIIALVIGTTLIPLIFGWIAIYFFDLDKLIGTAGNTLALKLVITAALAMTSIPVLSKIFLDLGIMQTTFAKISLATATIHDIILWIFISVAAGLVSGETVSVSNISVHVIISVLFFIVALVIMPKIIALIDRKKINIIPQNNQATAFIVLVLLAFTALASVLDINLVFGAFLAGIVINFIKNPKYDEVKNHIKDFSMAFLVPVYFGIVGIKLDLIRHLDIIFVIIFIIFAIIVQTIAVIVTSKYFLKYNWLSSFNLAVALNDRGGPCIVLATLAFELGIINENFFVTLVLLAIITSLTAGLWLRYVQSKGLPLLDEKE